MCECHQYVDKINELTFSSFSCNIAALAPSPLAIYEKYTYKYKKYCT